MKLRPKGRDNPVSQRTRLRGAIAAAKSLTATNAWGNGFRFRNNQAPALFLVTGELSSICGDELRTGWWNYLRMETALFRRDSQGTDNPRRPRGTRRSKSSMFSLCQTFQVNEKSSSGFRAGPIFLFWAPVCANSRVRNSPVRSLRQTVAARGNSQLCVAGVAGQVGKRYISYTGLQLGRQTRLHQDPKLRATDCLHRFRTGKAQLDACPVHVGMLCVCGAKLAISERAQPRDNLCVGGLFIEAQQAVLLQVGAQRSRVTKTNPSGSAPQQNSLDRQIRPFRHPELEGWCLNRDLKGMLGWRVCKSGNRAASNHRETFSGGTSSPCRGLVRTSSVLERRQTALVKLGQLVIG